MAQFAALKPEEFQVANLALLGNSTHAIADAVYQDVLTVETILKRPGVVTWMNDVKIQDASQNARLVKVAAAKDILEEVIKGAKRIIKKVNAEKWNKNHVEIFKMLTSDLTKEEARIVNNIMQQVNINGPVENSKSDMDELDDLISSLPASIQGKFWKEVILLATKFVNDFSKSTIIGAPVKSDSV